jgi:O-acetylserine/cysteine efflux transporter
VSAAHPPWRHLALALAVVAVWGSNFVIIKIGLAHLPPLLFAALRFAIAFFPAVLLLPRPAVSWRNLAAYGVLIGVGQFGVLYIAMKGSISPGLASLVIQTQVFFTIFLAMRLSHERVQPFQWLALALAATGVAVIAAHTGGDITVLGLLMVLGAAFCWACANIVSKRAGQVNMLAYVVWSSAAAVPPLLLMSLAFEGWPAIAAGVAQADAATWAAVLWQAVGNTLFGYAAWGWLLARHSAASITPMALLVPVFGMATSLWWLDEPLPAWKLWAAALVMCGLALNVLWPRLRPLRP